MVAIIFRRVEMRIVHELPLLHDWRGSKLHPARLPRLLTPESASSIPPKVKLGSERSQLLTCHCDGLSQSRKSSDVPKFDGAFSNRNHIRLRHGSTTAYPAKSLQPHSQESMQFLFATQASSDILVTYSCSSDEAGSRR